MNTNTNTDTNTDTNQTDEPDTMNTIPDDTMNKNDTRAAVKRDQSLVTSAATKGQFESSRNRGNEILTGSGSEGWEGRSESPDVDSYEGSSEGGKSESSDADSEEGGEEFEPRVRVPQLWRKARGGVRPNSGRKPGTVGKTARERMQEKLLKIVLALMGEKPKRKGKKVKTGALTPALSRGERGKEEGAKETASGASEKEGGEDEENGGVDPARIDYGNLKIALKLLLQVEAAELDRLKFERSCEVELEEEEPEEPATREEMEAAIQNVMGKEVTVL